MHSSIEAFSIMGSKLSLMALTSMVATSKRIKSKKVTTAGSQSPIPYLVQGKNSVDTQIYNTVELQQP